MTQQLEKRIRTVLLWLTLSVIAALLAIAVAGSFLGAERAKELLTSPLAGFWIAITAFTLATLAFLPAMLRRLPVVAMHLGLVLVLAGSMMNSPLGHGLAAKWLGSDKVPAGFVFLPRGAACSEIVDDRNRVLGQLPFDLRLRDFSIDHYPPKGDQWVLVAVKHSDGPHIEQSQLAWNLGEDVAIPGTSASLRVLEYLPHARPVYRGPKAMLEMMLPDVKRKSLPAIEGQEITLENPPATVHVEKVFSNFRVTMSHGQPEVIDAGGGELNPALAVSVRIGEKRARQFIFPYGGVVGEEVQGIDMRYAFAAEADPQSDRAAMRVAVAGVGEQAERWLIVRKGMDADSFSLVEELGEAAPNVDIFLAQTPSPIKSYKSDVDVMQDGKVVQHAVIEVNHPLSYGGYQISQADYDHDGGRFTVLSVTSNRAVWLVYAGMALLTGGVFAWCWGGPIFKHFRRRKEAPLETAGVHGH